MDTPVTMQPLPGRGGRPMLRPWSLEVVEAMNVAPSMRRVVFTADDIADFDYKPGQALVLMIPLADGETGRRDYTIRWFDRDAGRLAIDFLLHGETPGPQWAWGADTGDRLDARGPRGGTVFRADADWHLFTGDETCIPAIAHILETMPADAVAHVFIETQDASGEIPMARPVTWLHRGAAPAGPGTLMADAVSMFALPQGRGHAYLIGETSNVRAQRRLLVERGFNREQISSEGYWRPGRIGGHDHVED